MMNRILIFEPNADLCAQYRKALEDDHLWVFATTDREEAFSLIEKQRFHLCLWPLQDAQDITMIYDLKRRRPSLALIAASRISHPALIVDCIRAGASHFWVTGGPIEAFKETIRTTLARIIPDGEATEEAVEVLPHFVGKHPRMLEIFQLIDSIKNTDSTVLITGESGTGKEVVARAIHDLSPRRKAPWVAVNCGAIPSNLLESELFGHVRGAFTGATQNRMGRFQRASNGSLFLDEISDLPFDLQAKLLRAIQNREYEPVGSPDSLTLDARILAATNQDLELAVAEKRFRQDLFYRLNVIPIYIPPLRSRKSDIPLLVRTFLEKFCQQNGKAFVGISEEAMQFLMQYHWPGNIRELENLMERVVVLKKDEGIIDLKDFPVHHFSNVRVDTFVANVSLPEEGIDFNDAVNEFENELILQALRKTAGNKNKAATLLNLNRTTLVEKLKRKGLRIAS